MPTNEIAAAHGQSEEVARSTADVLAENAQLRAALELAHKEHDHRLLETVRRANADVERAEADALALREALNVLIAGIKEPARKDLEGYQLITNTAAVFARATLKVRPSGASLLAERAVAAAIVEAVRPVRGWLPRLYELYAAYDAARTAVGR